MTKNVKLGKFTRPEEAAIGVIIAGITPETREGEITRGRENYGSEE